jgi:hypothetical protein
MWLSRVWTTAPESLAWRYCRRPAFLPSRSEQAVRQQRRLAYALATDLCERQAWPKSPKRNEVKGSEGSWMS